VINALTVDVEDYFHVQAFAGVVQPADWSRYPSRIEGNTYRLLEILASRQICATFFILGWVAKRFPRLTRDIFNAGHEVGSHGHTHQMIGRGSKEDFREDIRRSKATIEDIIGVQIESYRAPSYSITANTLWALDVLSEEGFERDSSIFPVFHDYYGFPTAPRFPHYRRLRSGKLIAEFPPSTLRAYGVNLPVAGGGYLRLLPYAVTAWAIQRINQLEAQPALVYLHPWEIDPEQPRISARWLSRFRHYQNLHSTESKLARLLDDFSWASMSHVLSSSLDNITCGYEIHDGL
jgi:polysaccharide deacetylase family protein (PEP-CTERM system associated)